MKELEMPFHARRSDVVALSLGEEDGTIFLCC